VTRVAPKVNFLTLPTRVAARFWQKRWYGYCSLGQGSTRDQAGVAR